VNVWQLQYFDNKMRLIYQREVFSSLAVWHFSAQPRVPTGNWAHPSEVRSTLELSQKSIIYFKPLELSRQGNYNGVEHTK
jgi:hypothetical protein